MNSPKISIIVPVYNVGQYLEQCLDSIVNQTLNDIEIICINDGSTDNSAEILNSYAEKDCRIKVYSNLQSAGPLTARKTGVDAANGEYIMFADSDDYLEHTACQLLYEKINEYNVDMLQFSAKVINCANIDEARIKHLNDNRLKPYATLLKGADVFKACIIENKFSYTLWNKIYTAELCKRAFDDIKSSYLPVGEDLYIFFALTYHAKSYFGWQGTPLYNYCYGRGVTGNDEYTLEKFERHCYQAEAVKAMDDFCAEKNYEIPGCKDFLKKYYYNWLDACVIAWKKHLSKDIASDALDIMYKHWGAKEIISLMFNKYDKDREYIAVKIGKFKGKSLADKSVKTVAFYYSRYSFGGTEKVISLLMPMFVDMGYNVVLITEEKPSENDFPLPKSVIRVYIEKTDSDNYKKRIDSWENIVLENNIDLVIYNAWGSVKLLWDLMYLKSKDVSVVVHAHSVFSYRLLSMDERFFNMTPVYALLDGVVTLSNVDRLFWGTFNPNTYYIPNPVSTEMFDVSKAEWNNKTIIWIGRVTYEKNPEQPFEIMRKVKARIPDAKMYLLGDFTDTKWKEKANKYGLQDNIVFTGFVSNVNDYLAKSSIHLMTSSFEGFPMSLLEAKAYGIPTVMYELPHLEIGTKESGTIYVEQMDSSAAAEEIIKLLEDKEYWLLYSQKASECAKYFKSFDFKSAWYKVVEGNTPLKAGNEISDDLVKTIVNHYKLGVKTIKGNSKGKSAGFKSQVQAAIQCVKEKGIIYTVKLFFKKFI